MDSRNYLLLLFFKLILMNIYCHGIDTRWNVLKTDSLIFKYLKHSSAKSDFTVHHGLLNVDRTESFLSCNTGYGIFRLAAGTLHNKSSLILRTVGVADINRNSLFSYRENSIFMKNSSSHIGKLTKFTVCDGLNHSRILYNSRVCYKETGYISPVFIHISLNCLGNQRTSHIRTTSGKSGHSSIVLCTIEARHNCILTFGKTLVQKFVCFLRIQISVFIKTDHLCCIHKFITKISSHHFAVQIFSTGSGVISANLCFKILFDQLEILFHGKSEAKPFNNLIITRFDFF